MQQPLFSALVSGGAGAGQGSHSRMSRRPAGAVSLGSAAHTVAPVFFLHAVLRATRVQ